MINQRLIITRQKLNTHFYWSISHPPFAHLSTPTKSWRAKIRANWANQFSCVDKNAPCLFIHNNSSKHDCFSAGCVCANFCNFEPFSFPELRSFWSAAGIDLDPCCWPKGSKLWEREWFWAGSFSSISFSGKTSIINVGNFANFFFKFTWMVTFIVWFRKLQSRHNVWVDFWVGAMHIAVANFLS